MSNNQNNNDTVFRNLNANSKFADRSSINLHNEQLEDLKEKFIKVSIDFLKIYVSPQTLLFSVVLSIIKFRFMTKLLLLLYYRDRCIQNYEK
jgi:hypothetical protein